MIKKETNPQKEKESDGKHKNNDKPKEKIFKNRKFLNAKLRMLKNLIIPIL